MNWAGDLEVSMMIPLVVQQLFLLGLLDRICN